MSQAMKHLKELSVEIGPRGPTSENEKNAGDYIEQVMKSFGLCVEAEEFKSRTSFYWAVVVEMTLLITATCIFPISAVAAFLLGLIAVAMLIGEINMVEVLLRIIPKGRSQNIVAKIPPTGKTEKRIVLIGHYDSAKPTPLLHPAVVRYFDLSVIALFLSAVFTVLFYGLGSLIQFFGVANKYSVCFWYASFPLVGYLGIMSVMFAYGELFNTATDGANDNASGVSVILSISETLSKEPLKNTEVWCIATGCEEVGSVGMMRYLDRHAIELKNSFVLSVDCVGIGNLRYVTEEGIWKKIKVPTDFVDLVNETAKKNPEVQANPLVLKYKTSDSFPALARGLKAMCIIAVDEKNIPANWHWKTDVYANIEENTIEKAQRFVTEILRTIDAK